MSSQLRTHEASPLRLNSYIESLDAEVRVAAVSQDEQIRLEATERPRYIASHALKFKAARSVELSLGLLASVYEAVLYDLTDSGTKPLPSTGFARDRIGAAFESLLSFINDDLQGKINPVKHDGFATEDPSANVAALDAADFAVTQLKVAHWKLMAMLRRAIQVQDATTLREFVGKWTMPGSDLFAEATPANPFARAARRQYEMPDRLGFLVQSLDTAQVEIGAMCLHLLAYALRNPTGTGSDPDQAVELMVARLPAHKLWPILETAVKEPREPPDFADPVPGIIQAFLKAAILRPELTTGPDPSPNFAKAYAEKVRQAAGELMARPHEVTADEDAARAAMSVCEQITRVERAAWREQGETAINTPINQAGVDRLRDGCRWQFHHDDITSRLFAWAGKPASTETNDASHVLASVADEVPRSVLVSQDQAQTGGPRGFVLGGKLAQAMMGSLLAAAVGNGTSRVISLADSARRVREAITDLRGASAAGIGQQAAAASLVIMIPDPPGEISDHLELTGTEAESLPDPDQASGPPSERDKMLEKTRLLNEFNIVPQLVGFIDNVPVIRTKAGDLSRKLIVFDLARFAHLELAGSDDGMPGKPILELSEPNSQHQQTSGADEAGSGLTPLEAQIRSEMPNVEITAILFGRISITDDSACHILAW